MRRNVYVTPPITGITSSMINVSFTSTASMITSATKNGTNSPISVPMPRSSSYSASTSLVTRVMIRPTATRS